MKLAMLSNHFTWVLKVEYNRKCYMKPHLVIKLLYLTTYQTQTMYKQLELNLNLIQFRRVD